MYKQATVEDEGKSVLAGEQGKTPGRYQYDNANWPSYAGEDVWTKPSVQVDMDDDFVIVLEKPYASTADKDGKVEFLPISDGTPSVTIPKYNFERSGYTQNGWTVSTDKDPEINFYSGRTVTVDAFKEIASQSVIYATWQEKRGGGSSSGGSTKPVQPEGTFTGTWTYHPAIDKWTFVTSDGQQLISTWGYIFNPYAKGNQPSVSWFYFDSHGYMLTGWNWIRSAINGNIYCYYFHEISDNCLGMLYTDTYVGGLYYVNSDGHWCVDGVEQIRYR